MATSHQAQLAAQVGPVTNVYALADYIDARIAEAAVTIAAGAGATTNAPGGAVTIATGAGHATNANGGDLTLTLGAKAGTGRNGLVIVLSLPTADPLVVGALWSNSGVVTVSAG